jgi:tetratricopeptide (TPR) repeat protein
MHRRAALLLACLPLGSCAIEQPPVPMQQFVHGDLQPVTEFARERLQTGPVENRALVLDVLAQCELMQGDTEAAWRDFFAAAQIMGNWQVSGGEEVAAIVGSEGSKTYKGDPYEKAMNAFYLGMCFLWRGEPDNARASFKKGILADAESSDEKYQADFTLLFWLAGRMSRLMGLPQEAADFYNEARTADEFSREHGSRGDSPNPLLQDPERGNLMVLCECGMGPEKYAAGDQGELARFRPRWHPAARAQAWLDGKLIGPGYMLVDVDYQARTRGGTEMEGIRKGKAVFKTATAVAGVTALALAAGDHSNAGARDKAIAGFGLLLLSALTSSSADVRHWPTLPSTVQGIAIETTPGNHTLRIQFLDASGRVLNDLDQSWSVHVPEAGESWYLFRYLPGLDRLPRVTS